MDKMYIKDIEVKCIIGTQPVERKKKQAVIFNIMLECDLKPAGRSDKLADTLNYKTLTSDIVRLVEDSRYFLIERLADRVAAKCLTDRKVRAVTVSVEKPGALAEARTVSVEIRRTNRK